MKVKTRFVLALIFAFCVAAIATKPARALVGLSRGQNILLQRGLQIQALSFLE